MKSETKNSFMKNVMILMVAQIAIKVLGFIYKVVIINIEGFGDIGNGYYNTGYQIYSILLTLSSVGVPTVISKLVSERVAIGDHKGAYKIFKTALKLFTSIGVFFSIVLFFSAGFISKNFIGVEDVKYTIMVLAPAIAFVAASAVIRGFFSGLGNMKTTSISQTLEQFLNCVLSISFVYAVIGQSPATMAAAGNLSTTVAIILAFIYVLVYYKKRKKGIIEECLKQTVPTEKKDNKELIKTILAISIPMTIGSLISVVNSTIDTLTISNCIQTAYSDVILLKEDLEQKAMELYGVLSKVEVLIHLPLAVTATFCTALVPAISESIAKKEIDIATKRLSFSFFASILIILPCAIGMAVLAEPILKMIYPTVSDGAGILALTTVTMILVSLNYVVNGTLYGLGKTKVPMIALGIGGLLKLALNILLISNPKINIYGAAISSIVCQGISLTICIICMLKYIKLDLNFIKCFIKPIISSLLMGALVFGAYKLLAGFGNGIATIIAILIGIIIYTILIIVTKTLSKEDFHMIPFGTKIYNILEKYKIYR